MTHEVLQSVVEAQTVNASLSGSELRRAAENLVRLAAGQTQVKALDAVGERVIGAALMLSDSVRPWDYTVAFPSKYTCLLVGGVVAGPAGLAVAAQAARAAGASCVHAAILSGWTKAVPGVSRIYEIGDSRMQVA